MGESTLRATARRIKLSGDEYLASELEQAANDIAELTKERDELFLFKQNMRLASKKEYTTVTQTGRMRKALEKIAGTNDVDGNSQECDSAEEMRWVAQEAIQYIPELDKCPQCGGPADNGHDRCDPPTPYLCTKCIGGCEHGTYRTEYCQECGRINGGD